MDLELPAELLLVPAIFTVFYYWRAFRTFFNPVSLFISSFVATLFFAHVIDFLSIHFAVWGYFQAEPTQVTWLYALGICAFLAPWVLYPKPLDFFTARGSERPYVDDFGRIRSVATALAVVLLIVLVLTFIEMGGIPVLAMFAGSYSHWEHVDRLYHLPLGLMALNLAVTFALVLYLASFLANAKKYGVGGHYLTFLVTVLLLSASWQGNRQIFLMLLFFIFARRLVDKKITGGESFSMIAMARTAFVFVSLVTLFSALFTFIGIMRMKASGGGEPFDLLQYFAWPVYNMIAIAQKLAPDDDLIPHYILSELMPARFGGRDRVSELSEYVFEPSSPSSYFAYWFLDFGYAGVAMGGFALGLFARWTYSRRLRDETAMRVYLLALWCCATAGVYSHFISMNYFVIPFLIQMVQNPLFGKRRYAPRRAAPPHPFPLAGRPTPHS